MKHHSLNLSIIIICILTLYVVGCGQDDEAEPTNSLPTVDDFIVPEEFSTGDVLEFKIIAHDADGDTLSYTWEIDGTILESTGTEAKWTAPDDVESVKVTVHISDGIGKSIKRVKTIKNKEFITPEPIVPPDVIDVAPDPPLNMIVPGKGAYGIKLGDPFKKVEALHGEPDGPIGVDQIFTYWENPDKGLAGHINGIGNVEDIFLSRPNKAKTADGNGIGSALDSVVREFGNADEIDNDVFGGLRHWYFKEGIEFTIDEEEKVQFIFLYSPFEEIPDDIGIQEAENAEAPKNAAMTLQRLRTQLKSTSEN